MLYTVNSCARLRSSMATPAPKALLKVGYMCNNNCVFCHSAPHRGHESTLEEIDRKVTAAARLGARMLVLSGGDPTVRRDLLDIAALVGKAGLGLGLVTNGRMLAYRGLAKKLLDAGLQYAQVSLAGPIPEIHNRHARTDSFKQTIAGISHLAGSIEKLTVNVVITRWNLDHLDQISDLLNRFPNCRLKLSVVEPEGNALASFDTLVPSLTETASRIVAVIERAARQDTLPRPVFDGLPLCLVPARLHHRESGLREDGFFMMSEALENDWYPINESNRRFAPSCRTCSLRQRCRGVYEQYLLRRGDSELQALAVPVANSFLVEGSAGCGPGEDLFGDGTCRVRQGRSTPPDPVRGVLVDTGKGFFCRYHVSTRDFSDAAITHALQQQEQLYASRQDLASAGDISRHLRKLSLVEQCRSCSLRRLCGGAWRQERKTNAFVLFERILREQVATLRGKILDIGCGRAWYWPTPATGTDLEQIDYTGIDPRAGEYEVHPGTSILPVAFEEFTAREHSFDAIMAIRSLSHLRHPARAIARMEHLLVPGGTLLLAEDDILGVLVTAIPEDQRDRPPGQEHFTNIRLDDAMSLCRENGLRPSYWLSSGQTNSPCWLLRCVSRA